MKDVSGILTLAALSERRRLLEELATVRDRRYKKFKARKSSRGSSKLQLPNEVTNFRRALIRSVAISHSRQANNMSSNENDFGFSSSSMAEIWPSSQLCSAASTPAPSTLRNPCIFVFTSPRNCRIG